MFWTAEFEEYFYHKNLMTWYQDVTEEDGPLLFKKVKCDFRKKWLDEELRKNEVKTSMKLPPKEKPTSSGFDC